MSIVNYTQKSDVNAKVKEISDYITGSAGDWPNHSYSAFIGAYDFTIESGSNDTKIFEFNTNPSVQIPLSVQGSDFFDRIAQYAVTQSYSSVNIYGSTWADMQNPRQTKLSSISASFANHNISSSFVYDSSAPYVNSRVEASSSKFHLFVDTPNGYGADDTLYTMATGSMDKTKFRTILQSANVGETFIDGFTSSSIAANRGVGTWPDFVLKSKTEDGSLLVSPFNISFNSYITNAEQRNIYSSTYTDADGVEQTWESNSDYKERVHTSMTYWYDIETSTGISTYPEKFIPSSGSLDGNGNKYLGTGRAYILFTPQHTEVLCSYYSPQYIQINPPTGVSSSIDNDWYKWKLVANRGTTTPSGSLIRMYDGSTKQIQDVEVGDVVKSYQPVGMSLSDHDFAAYSSTDLTNSVSSGSVVLEVSSNVQPEHYIINDTYKFGWMGMIFVKRANEYKFLRAFEIEVGDELMDKDGNLIEVTSTVEVTTDETFYSLDVEDIDTYFSSDILVHNLPPKGGGGA